MSDKVRPLEESEGRRPRLELEPTPPSAERKELEAEVAKTAKETDFYDKKITEINENKDIPDKLKDIETLKASKIEDIRFNSRLLKKKEGAEEPAVEIENVKEETARRLRAYTEKDGEWYTLNYKNVGGMDHELHVGLGDVLLDPDIEEITVQKASGELIACHRGIVQEGKYKGRRAFLNEKDKYVATYSGDKFKFGKFEKSDFKKYQQEENERLQDKAAFKTRAAGTTANLDTLSEVFYGKTANFLTDEQITSKLNSHREEQDGQQILEYMKKVCEEFGVPFVIYREMIQVESKFNPDPTNTMGSAARGLGQFMPETWTEFTEYCTKNNIFDERWGTPPLTQDHRANPYANAYASAWLMSRAKNALKLEAQPIQEQGVAYYMRHHEGPGGYRGFVRFFNAMQKDGYLTEQEIIAAFKADPGKYYPRLHEDQRQENRVLGPNGIIHTYFKFAKNIGLKALAASSTGEKLPIARINSRFKTPEGHPSRIVMTGKETLITGSSTAGGVDTDAFDVLSIGGAGPISYLSNLKQIFSQLKKTDVPLPREVVVTGLAVNGMDPGKPIAEEVEKNILAYKEIVAFFENEGIRAKVATVQPYEEKKDHLMAFNEALRAAFPNCVDLEKNILTSEGEWDKKYKASDNLHLSSDGHKILKNLVEKSRT